MKQGGTSLIKQESHDQDSQNREQLESAILNKMENGRDAKLRRGS